MATTFRADIADGILAVLNTYAAANPTKLVRAYRARPESIAAADLPAALIDKRPERIGHSMQIRTRTMTPSVVVVRRVTDNLEDMAAFDELVDALVDAFTAQPQFASATIWDEMSVDDEEYVIGDYQFPAVRFTFGDISIEEGRT